MNPSESQKKPKKKEHVFSLRLKKSLLNEIDEAAKKLYINKSDFIRKAISDAISFQEFNRFSQVFFMGPNMLKFSLDLMDELQIEDFAQLALNNGQKFLSIYLKKQMNSSITEKYLENKKTIISGLLLFITESILSQSGQGWYERIRFSWRKDSIVITGVHNLGEKFSIFTRYYFIHFFSLFDFHDEPGLMILEENRIKFVFTGELSHFDLNILLNPSI